MRRWLILWVTMLLVALILLAMGPLAYDRLDANRDGQIDAADALLAKRLELEIVEHIMGRD